MLAGLRPSEVQQFRELLRTAAAEVDRVDHVEDFRDIPEQIAVRRRPPAR